MKSLEREFRSPKGKGRPFILKLFGCSYSLMVCNFHLFPLLSMEVVKEINVELNTGEYPKETVIG